MAAALGEKILLLIFAITVLLCWKPNGIGIAFSTLAVLIFRMHLERSQRVWRLQNVKGPPASLLFGNLLQLRDGIHVADTKNFVQFPQTHGTYLLGHPELVSKELRILNGVLRSQFSNFSVRFRSDIMKNPGSPAIVHHTLDQLEGKVWETARTKIFSALSDANLALMMPHIQRSALRLCHFVQQRAQQSGSVQLKDAFSRFTFDITAKIAFDKNTDPYAPEGVQEEEFISRFREILSFSFSGNKNLLYSFFPNLFHWFQKITGVDLDQSRHHAFFQAKLEALYEERKRETPEEQRKHEDFLQMLIEAEDDGYLSKEDLIGQCFILLMAGSDTVATALEFIAYVLAHRPDIQERVRAEVEEVMQDEDALAFAAVRNLRYMSAVIKETMRVYPVACRTNRVCTKDTVLNGIALKAGTVVAVPIYAIHHDPAFYPEPEKFDPDRFLRDELPTEMNSEDKSSFQFCKYLAFGAGRRGCVGKRLAELELKVALTYFVRHFRLEPGPKMPALPIELKSLGLTKSAVELTATPTLCREIPQP